MFYDRFFELCEYIGKAPSAVAVEIGISKSTVSTWKNLGRIPKNEQLKRIADYFGVSQGYLLGDESHRYVVTKGFMRLRAALDPDFKIAAMNGWCFLSKEMEKDYFFLLQDIPDELLPDERHIFTGSILDMRETCKTATFTEEDFSIVATLNTLKPQVDALVDEYKKIDIQKDAEQEVRYEHSLGVTNVARGLQQELDKLRLLEDPLVAFYGEVKDQLDDDDREDLIAFLRIKAERKNKK